MGLLAAATSEDLASVTLFTPRDGRALNGSHHFAAFRRCRLRDRTVRLQSQQQRTDLRLLAQRCIGPRRGTAQRADRVHPAHQRNDCPQHRRQPPTRPGDAFTWPIYNNVDYSRLGNWTTYLGFFERPTAHGPFAAVYDHAADAGIVRIFPPQVTAAAKSLAWAGSRRCPAISTPTMARPTSNCTAAWPLPGDLSLCRRAASSVEAVWYPVRQIGGVTWADEVATLTVARMPPG
ncbi:MAG: hypothetical protein R2856_15435 [Caldilineaceae bacterium]